MCANDDIIGFFNIVLCFALVWRDDVPDAVRAQCVQARS
jgi:hypothetical protein